MGRRCPDGSLTRQQRQTMPLPCSPKPCPCPYKDPFLHQTPLLCSSTYPPLSAPSVFLSRAVVLGLGCGLETPDRLFLKKRTRSPQRSDFTGLGFSQAAGELTLLRSPQRPRNTVPPATRTRRLLLPTPGPLQLPASLLLFPPKLLQGQRRRPSSVP